MVFIIFQLQHVLSIVKKYVSIIHCLFLSLFRLQGIKSMCQLVKWSLMIELSEVSILFDGCLCWGFHGSSLSNSTKGIRRHCFQLQTVESFAHTLFCRTMLCISAAYAVMRCLSVCLSRSCILWKRINVSSKFLHRRVASPPRQTYSDQAPRISEFCLRQKASTLRRRQQKIIYL